MTIFALITAMALNAMRANPFLPADKAWDKAVNHLFWSGRISFTTATKGCPKAVFLALVHAGLFVGIHGNYLKKAVSNYGRDGIALALALKRGQGFATRQAAWASVSGISDQGIAAMLMDLHTAGLL